MNHEEHEGREGFTKGAEPVASAVVDSAIKVHRALGAGLLESAYEQCLAYELKKRGLSVRTQVPMPLIYEGLEIGAGYRIDILVEEIVIVEVKAIDALLRVHEAQVLTYLKLSRCRLGFLMNFNVPLMKQGIRRFIL